MQEFKPAKFMQLVETLRLNVKKCDKGDGFADVSALPTIQRLMQRLAGMCQESGLPVSAVAAHRAANIDLGSCRGHRKPPSRGERRLERMIRAQRGSGYPFACD